MLPSELNKYRAYYKGKAYNELLLLIAIQIVVRIFSSHLILTSSILYVLIGLIIQVVWVYRIFYYCQKSKSSRTFFYIAPMVLNLICSLPVYYYMASDPFALLSFTLQYPWYSNLTSLIGLYVLVVSYIGYKSLKKEMQYNNISLGLMGPNKAELEAFKPND